MKTKLFLALLLPSLALAESEKYYQTIDCTNLNGTVEYRNVDGTRTDCVTSTEVIEYDFATIKWYECISQAGYYSMLSGQPGVCTLIIEGEDGKGSEMYVERAKKYVEYYRMPVKLRVITAKPEWSVKEYQLKLQ